MMISEAKILYVEDEKSVQQFVKILFKKNAIKDVVFASNGKEALKLYKESNFDIVITDMLMPIMNGFELINEIKKINNKQIFMMVTGLDDKENLIKAIELRVNFFLEKPINPKKFTYILKDAISLSNQKKELELSNIILNQYKQAIDKSSILSKFDMHGVITYANDRFCEISQYSKDELIGKKTIELRHPDTPVSIFEDVWSTITSKKQWQGILKYKIKNGDIFIGDFLITPLLNSNGELLEYISMSHDITKLELYTNDLQHQLSLATEDIVETQKEVVYTMGAIGETRSKETGNHVKRVANYSYILAKLAGLSDDKAELLRLASPMHDIGKVGIPDNILNKPGKLTNEEFEIMKTHSTLGYDMLKGSNKDILRTSAIVAVEHHEKWDGSGYPKQLKAEEINIYGRITAICDVFDALGSDRCYKKAWSLDKILNLLKEEKAKHFDPNLVDLFIDNLDEFLVIRDLYKDKDKY